MNNKPEILIFSEIAEELSKDRSIFTTLLYQNGFLIFFEDHWSRLEESLHYFSIVSFNKARLRDKWNEFLKKQIDLIPQIGLYRFKISLAPVTRFIHNEFFSLEDLSFIISISSLNEVLPELKSENVKIIIKELPSSFQLDFPTVKHENYDFFFETRRETLKNDFGEVFYTINNKDIVRATAASFFLESNGFFIFPPVSKFTLVSITTSHLKIMMTANKISWKEEIIFSEHLSNADRLFLSNSLHPHLLLKEKHNQKSFFLNEDLRAMWKDYIQMNQMQHLKVN